MSSVPSNDVCFCNVKATEGGLHLTLQSCYTVCTVCVIVGHLVVFSTDLLENLLRQMADDLRPHLCVLFRELGTVNIVCDSKNLALCTFEYSVNMIAVPVAYTVVLTLLLTRALFLL